MKFCTLHLSRSHDDHWGATDSAAVSLQLTLFSDSFRVSQNLNPVQSNMLFSQLFFCLPLLFPLCTVPCKIILASLADFDTWTHDKVENISWMKFLFRHSSNSRKLSREKFVCQKCRLKSTSTNGWRHFGQSHQRKSSVLFPIQSERSSDSGFFACDLWKDIMPSSRKQITEIKGEGMIIGYNWKVSETTTFQVVYCACAKWFSSKLHVIHKGSHIAGGDKRVYLSETRCSDIL